MQNILHYDVFCYPFSTTEHTDHTEKFIVFFLCFPCGQWLLPALIHFQPRNTLTTQKRFFLFLVYVLNQYIAAVAHQVIESGEAQTATVVRDEALDAFMMWIDRYKKVVKIALKPYPKLLKKLGM